MLNTTHKVAKVNRTIVISGEKKWIDESLKEVMDATKGRTCTLKRAIRSWKIFMFSFSNQFEQQDKI
jgi:hypothetical protein